MFKCNCKGEPLISCLLVGFPGGNLLASVGNRKQNVKPSWSLPTGSPLSVLHSAPTHTLSPLAAFQFFMPENVNCLPLQNSTSGGRNVTRELVRFDSLFSVPVSTMDPIGETAFYRVGLRSSRTQLEMGCWFFGMAPGPQPCRTLAIPMRFVVDVSLWDRRKAITMCTSKGHAS